MAKEYAPIMFMMFAVVLLSGIIITMAAYYGGDWTWIAQQNASLVLVIIVLGVAAFTLVSWLKRRS